MVFFGLSSAVMTSGEVYAVDAPKCVLCFSLAGRVSGLLPEPRCVISINNTSSQMQGSGELLLSMSLETYAVPTLSFNHE